MAEPTPNVDSPAAGEASLRVVPGAHVEVELVEQSGGTERLAFDIVPNEAADFANGFLGAGTPLARTLLGQRAGSVIPYTVADIREVRILSVVPGLRTPESDAAARRQMIADEAVNKANLEDAVRLALTVDVKWGDYDPEGLAENW